MSRRKNSAKLRQQERADVIPSKRPEIYTAEYAGYLVCDLTAAHEKELEQLVVKAEELLSFQDEMVDSGYKLVYCYSKDGASVRAELHDLDNTSDTAGWRLSSFADTPTEALVVLRYKYTVVLGSDLSNASRTRTARRFG